MHMAWWLAFSKCSKILVFTIPQNFTFKEMQGLDQGAQISRHSAHLLPLVQDVCQQHEEDFEILVEPKEGRGLGGRNLPTDCLGLLYERESSIC